MDEESVEVQPPIPKIPACAIHWINMEALYSAEEWSISEVKEWLDSIYDDLEIAYMKDGPIKHPDKRNVKYAQEQAMKGVKLVQSAFAAMKMRGADLCNVNEELLTKQGIDTITRKAVLRHIEVLIGAPSPPPHIKLPSLLRPDERGALNSSKPLANSLKLVIILGSIVPKLDQTLCSIISEMVTYEEAESEDAALQKFVSVTAEILEMAETIQVEMEPSDLKKSKKKVKKKEGEEGNEKKAIQIGTTGGEKPICSNFRISITDKEKLLGLQESEYTYHGTLPFAVDSKLMKVESVVTSCKGNGVKTSINLQITFPKKTN